VRVRGAIRAEEAEVCLYVSKHAARLSECPRRDRVDTRFRKLFWMTALQRSSFFQTLCGTNDLMWR
jgi:hypothetical protein